MKQRLVENLAVALAAVLLVMGCRGLLAPTSAVTPPPHAAVAGGELGAKDPAKDPAIGQPVVDGGVAKQPKPILPASPGKVEDYGQGAPALTALFSSLRRLAVPSPPPDARVDFLLLGDSHTAGDVLTSYLRHRLQQQYGDAGRGFLLPGKPLHHYYQRDAEYHTRGTWIVERGLKKEALEPLGMAGVRMHSAAPEAEVDVGTCEKCGGGHNVARFEIWYHPRPDGGRLGYRVDEGAWETLDTRDGDEHTTAFFDVRVPDGPHHLTLRPAGQGPVDLFGVALERDAPGAIVDSVGYVGARAYHLHKWDWSFVGPQVAHRDPRLVVIQYGTNETDERQLDLDRLEEHFVDLVGRVRQAAPNASILILGPPDRAMRERRDCEGPKAKNKKAKGKKGKPAKPVVVVAKGPPPPGCEWKTPQILLDVIAAERRAAQRTGVAFFDMYEALGGRDQMDEWVHATPPLAYGDRVHLTRPGYERAGDLLLNAIARAYDAWLATAPAPAAVAVPPVAVAVPPVAVAVPPVAVAVPPRDAGAEPAAANVDAAPSIAQPDH